MENCVVIGNQVGGDGGGMYVGNGTNDVATLTNTIIVGNTVAGNNAQRDVHFEGSSKVVDGGNNIIGAISHPKITDPQPTSILGGLEDTSEFAPERLAALQAVVDETKAAATAGAVNLAPVIATQSVKLRAAIAALEEEIPQAIEDGPYTLDVRAWHGTNDNASMMAPILAPTARLDVTDGAYAVTLDFVKASIMGVSVNGETVIEVWPEKTAAEVTAGTGISGTYNAEDESKTVTIPLSTLDMPNLAIRVGAPMNSVQTIRLNFDLDSLTPAGDPEPPQPTGYVPGIYSGVGQGYPGNAGGPDIQVFVQTSESEIVKIFAGAHSQTTTFWNMAWGGAYGGKSIPSQILENQGLDGVDVVSGATLSSNGIKQAAAAALANAAAGTAAAPDEVQTVPAALWNANADQPSMMNGMLIPAAEVRKYGAEYTAAIKIGPTSIYGIAVNGSDAQNFRMANEAGEFVTPPVTEVYDETTQIKTLEVWLPANTAALPQNYKSPLPIRLFVAPMGSDQTVRLKLTFGVEKDKLEAAIAAAAPRYGEENLYTAESFAPFKSAYEAAQAVRADEEATQEQVDAAAKALGDAGKALVLRPRERVANTIAELIAYVTTDVTDGDVIRLGADLPAQGETISGASRRLLPVGKSITVDGQGHTLDGQDNFGFFQITGGTLTVENVVFRNARILPESTGQVGTAAYVTGGNLVMRNCVIVDNVAIKAQNAGVYVQGGRDIVMEHCVLIGNQAKTGAGLLLSSGVTGRLTGNIVIGSIASTDAGTVCRDVNFGQNNSPVVDGGRNIFGTVYGAYAPAAPSATSLLGGLEDPTQFDPARWDALQDAVAALKAAALAGAADVESVIAGQAPKLRAAIAGLTEEDPNAGTYTKENLQKHLDVANSLQETRYTPESWAALQAAVTTAKSVLAEAGAPVSKIGAAIGGLRAAIMGLALADPADPGDAYPALRVSVGGPASAKPGQPVSYVISVRDARALAVVRVRYEYDEASLRFVSAQAQNGFSVLASQEGSATVSWLDDAEGLTAVEATPVITLHFVVKDDVSGAATVKITDVEAASYPAVSLRIGSIDPDVVRTEFLAYDFNRDGVVNLADLAWAQKYFRAEAGDDDWETAKAADVNKNGTVEIGDFILILKAVTPQG
ncbi:MAG: NEAT domain-containing protein [Oscillospiraceae bacterium]|jgi:uncharacterized protein with FMN-binding domain|nr:NEAT domain-containing protein [Oscillospiraceae bacterium]